LDDWIHGEMIENAHMWVVFEGTCRKITINKPDIG